jgi:hypothetical protein
MKTFHKPLPILSIFALLLVAVWACRKEKPAFDLSDKDPCSCASEVSAEFIIEERATHIPTDIWDETDTTNWGSMVRFTAKEQGAQYTWYIGSQVFNSRSVSRFFSEEWKENDIPITLVVNKQPNLTCFPNDDGYDSITKTFHVSKYPIEDKPNKEIYHPIEGTYRVFGPSVEDSIDVTLNIRFTGVLVPTYDIINPDGLGTECISGISNNPEIRFLSFRRVNFGRNASFGFDFCTGIEGEITRNEKNEVVLMLSTKYNLLNPTDYSWEFKGRKIN